MSFESSNLSMRRQLMKYSPRLAINDRNSQDVLDNEKRKAAEHLLNTDGPKTWTFSDFAGKYHIRNLKSKYPIPGKIVRYEQEKIARIEAENKRFNEMEIEKEKKDIQFSNKFKIYSKHRIDFMERGSTIAPVMNKIEEILVDRREMLQQTTKTYEDEFNHFPNEFEKAFHQAFILGDGIVMQRMMNNGVDIDAFDEHGRTPLINAVRTGRCKFVKLLLEAGANPNLYDKLGRTPLLWAYESIRFIDNSHKFTKIVHLTLIHIIFNLLLENGANPNIKLDSSGQTILHVAASKGHYVITRALLIHKANPHIKDSKNRIALDIAIENKHVTTCILLKNWKFVSSIGMFIEYRQKWQTFLKDETTSLDGGTADNQRIIEELKNKELLIAYEQRLRKTLNVVEEMEGNDIDSIRVKVFGNLPPPFLSSESKKLKNRNRHHNKNGKFTKDKLNLFHGEKQENDVVSSIESSNSNTNNHNKTTTSNMTDHCSITKLSDKRQKEESQEKKNTKKILFRSKRRTNELVSKGLSSPKKLQNKTKKPRDFGLLYDVRYIRETYLPGTTRGRPKSWRPSVLSTSIDSETANLILRSTDSEYAKKLVVEKKDKEDRMRKKAMNQNKNRFRYNKNLTIECITKDAPIVGYQLRWDEVLDKEYQKQTFDRTAATSSVVLRPRKLNNLQSEDGGDIKIYQYGDMKAAKAKLKVQNVSKMAKLGQTRAHMMSKWVEKDITAFGSKRLPRSSHDDVDKSESYHLNDDTDNTRSSTSTSASANAEIDDRKSIENILDGQSLMISSLNSEKQSKSTKKMQFVEDKSILPPVQLQSTSGSLKVARGIPQNLRDILHIEKPKERPWLREDSNIEKYEVPWKYL